MAATPAGALILAKQVCLDNFCYTPFVYFPVFYLSQTVIQGDAVCSGTEPYKVAEDALQQYGQNVFVDNAFTAAVFIPGDVLVFLMPVWLRMPVLHSFNFTYAALLSSIRGSKEPVCEATASPHGEVPLFERLHLHLLASPSFESMRVLTTRMMALYQEGVALCQEKVALYLEVIALYQVVEF